MMVDFVTALTPIIILCILHLTNKYSETASIKKILGNSNIPKIRPFVKFGLQTSSYRLEDQLEKSRIKLEKYNPVFQTYYLLFLIINQNQIGDNRFSFLNICGEQQVFAYSVKRQQFEERVEKILAKNQSKFSFYASYQENYYFWKNLFLEYDCKNGYVYLLHEYDWLINLGWKEKESRAYLQVLLFLLLDIFGFNLDKNQIDNPKHWLTNPNDSLSQEKFIELMQIFARFLTAKELLIMNQIINFAIVLIGDGNFLPIVVGIGKYRYYHDKYSEIDSLKNSLEKEIESKGIKPITGSQLSLLPNNPKLIDIILELDAVNI
jgi:hypothetical protein